MGTTKEKDAEGSPREEKRINAKIDLILVMLEHAHTNEQKMVGPCRMASGSTAGLVETQNNRDRENPPNFAPIL